MALRTVVEPSCNGMKVFKYPQSFDFCKVLYSSSAFTFSTNTNVRTI